jgi:glycosyltransferase involved in cell wall biosynthesis
MKVVFFHRKPRPNVNFSVESLFEQIRKALPKEVQWEVKVLKYFSDGFFKRLYISFEAAFSQKGINHVTGDVNFIAIFLKKKRTVLTMLDVGLMKNPNPVARKVLQLFWIILPVKRSAIITTISQSTKDELLKYVSTDPNRIKVVYVPISKDFQHRPKQFNKTKPTILQIGTKPNKNVNRLAQALQGIPCKLEIIGVVNDALRIELEKAGVEYVSSQNLTNRQVIEKYEQADVISFVSTYEGFGMPIVEANAVGRVVVTSNILSMPEVAGDAAHLVDPFDVKSIRSGLLKVINDDQYRNTLIENGFTNQNRFDVDTIAKQFTDIYRALSTK